MLLACALTSCVLKSNVPNGYIGFNVMKAEVHQKSYSKFSVTITQVDSKFPVTKVKAVLNRIGIQFSESGNQLRFNCSRAELIGFLATISDNGTASAFLGEHEIACGKLGFPIDVHGDLAVVVRGQRKQSAPNASGASSTRVKQEVF
jgi:hypothetical protein